MNKLFNRTLFALNGFFFSVSLSGLIGVQFVSIPVLILSGVYLTYQVQSIE